MDETLKQLKRIAKKSKGKMRVVDVPPEMHLTAESKEKLEKEIAAQADANDRMHYNSYMNARRRI